MEGDQSKPNTVPGPAPTGQSSSLAPLSPSTNQAPPVSPSPAPAQPEPPQKRPLLRTMKSDTEELFKTSRPGLSQMIGSADSGQRFFGNLSKKKKNSIVVAVFAFLLLVGGGFYVWRTLQEGGGSVVRPSKLVTPPPFFITETSRTITVKAQDRLQFFRLIQDTMREQERYGSIKRLIIKLQERETERFATLADLFNFYNIRPPERLLNFVDKNLMVFVYYSEGGSRFGFAVKALDPDRTLLTMLNWEPAMLADFEPFFFGEMSGDMVGLFEDRTYRNIDWRLNKFNSPSDLGIAYVVFPAKDILVVTMSKSAMESVINRLFEAR